METDVKETVQRKVGPLPVWGWVVAIGGAVFVLRKLRGGSSAPTQYVGTPSVVGGGGVTGGTGTDNTGETTLLQSQLDTLSQRVDVFDTLSETVAGLSTTVSNDTSVNSLQTKLISALQTLNAAIAQRERLYTVKSDTYLQYKQGTISATAYKSKIANLDSQIAVQQSIIDTQTKTIDDAKTAISKVGA